MMTRPEKQWVILIYVVAFMLFVSCHPNIMFEDSTVVAPSQEQTK